MILILLSLILLFYIVVPNRKVANINSFTYNSTISNSMGSNIISEDINIDLLRDRFNSLSPNFSRLYGLIFGIYKVILLQKVSLIDALT